MRGNGKALLWKHSKGTAVLCVAKAKLGEEKRGNGIALMRWARQRHCGAGRGIAVRGTAL